MRKINPLIVAGALTALVGAAGLAMVVQKDPSSPTETTRKVVVASAAVAPGTPAAQAALEVKSVPAAAVVPGTATDPVTLSGQVALRPLAAGEMVTPGAFGVQGVAADGGVILPEGKEGIGVELGFPQGGLRYVVPGNRITVWATRKPAEGERPRAEAILENVQVIATTPGAGTGAATEVVPGPGNLQFLLALSRGESARLIEAQVGGAALYFTLADSAAAAS